MNLRTFLVSKLGRAIIFLVSAFLATALGELAAHVPWLPAEKLVEVVGGQFTVTLAIMLALREGLTWAVSHWAWLNFEGVRVLQDALNEQLGANLKTDGLLMQKTGIELNKALGNKVDLPVAQLAQAAKGGIAKLASMFLLAAACAVASGCETPGRVGVSVPLGNGGEYGFLEIGWRAPSLYALADAPAGLGLEDFKKVVSPSR